MFTIGGGGQSGQEGATLFAAEKKNVAKLSRVYQFNGGNMAVISHKELEGREPESQISSRPRRAAKTSGIRHGGSE